MRHAWLIRRVYDPPGPAGGYRVVVDRMWPRGVSKSSAEVDRWLREIAPSTELRKWFGHRPDRWLEFQRLYHRELQHDVPGAVEELRNIEHARVTLLYAAKDEQHNNAVALLAFLKDKQA